MEETFISQYPILLGQPLVASPADEFYDDKDLGKNVYVVAFNGTHSVKLRGTLIAYDSTSRSITLNPLVSLNEDGTDLHTLPRPYTFPTYLFGAGYQFRASRTGIPSLYSLAYRKMASKVHGFDKDPVVRMGGKSKKRKKRKTKKR